MGFEVNGLEEWKQKLLDLSSTKFPTEKKKEVRKIALMAEREIKLLVPVDTGRLRASITTEVESESTATVGTNVEYAKDVNYGFTMKQRFLPAKYLNTVSGRKYLGKGNDKGITIHAQSIIGKHFMEKGMQNAEPKILAELNRWLDDMLRKLGGSK